MKNTIFTATSLILDGWTFYSNDTPPAEYEAYAGANRMLLTCDGERIDCQLELGMLMAEADYLIASEHLDSFERNKEDPLVLKFLTDKCLTREENK